MAALLPSALGVTWVAGRAPEAVERAYAGGVYPWIARGMAGLFGWIPFPVAEVLAACLLGLAAIRLARGLRAWRLGLRTLLNLSGHAGLQVLSAVSLAVFLFTALWGLNYRRPALAQRLHLDTRAPSTEELTALGRIWLQSLQELAPGLPRNPDGTLMETAPGLEDLGNVAQGYARLASGGSGHPRRPVRPKKWWGTPLLDLSLTSGIFIPFTGEPLVNDGIPPSRKPFIAAHEVAHSLGHAREDEASFLGLQACAAHPDALWRYSGALEGYSEVRSGLRALDPAAARILDLELPPGARADLAAHAAWGRRLASPLGTASGRIYGQYLKVQGQPRGLATYHEVLLLMLGDWRAAGARRGP